MSPTSRIAAYVRLGLAALLTLGVLVVVQLGLTNARLDLTRNGLYTLSDGSRKVLAALDEPIDIRFYYSDEATAEIPLIRNYATRVRELLEEMSARSKGKLRLAVIDPKPFSEDEDRASALGLTAVPLGPNGEGNVFFGLSGSSATGEQASIPFLQPDKEAFLEYDLVKLIHTLAHPEKPVVGLLSSLPMAAALDPATRAIRQPWAVLGGWQELFDVRMLDPATTVAIEPAIETLILVHPKRWSADLLYAIDQFVLRGGHLLVFVDPHAELDPGTADPEDPMAAMLDDRSSDLAPLFARWGVRFDPARVVLDAQAALTVQSPAGGQVKHPAIVGYGRQQLNQADVVTANLAVINMASVGALTQTETSTVKLMPLIQSTADSMLIDSARMRMQPDPADLFKGFVSSKTSQVLAARLQGRFLTSFPERRGEGHLAASRTDTSIVVVADTDLLADRLWVQPQDFFQQTVMNAFANNGDFAINTVDNLVGSTDLIGVRGRAISARPFTRVEALRLQADDRFRQKETELNAELEETEKKLNALQGARAGDGGIALTPAQTAELERFQTQKLRIRKDLREVRRQLDADIEALGNRLKLLNILLVPIAVGLLAVLFAASPASGRSPRAAMIFTMRTRFVTLLTATLVVVAAAAWMSTRRQQGGESDSELWLPGLRADLDRVSAIRITGAGGKGLATIERDPAGFVVVERDRYRADTAILRTFLLQLADARRIEAKTARADRHAALGVESVASAKATGVRVDIEGTTSPLSFTIGRTADQLGGGTFVRAGDEAQAWLVSGNLMVERDPQRWLEKRIVDIPPARIERIEVRANGEEFALVRAAATAAPAATNEAGAPAGDAPTQANAEAIASSTDVFVLEGVPAADLASDFATAATAAALGELDLLDVSTRKRTPAPSSGTTELHFLLRNGVRVDATSWKDEGRTLLQLQASATPVPRASPPAVEGATAERKPAAAADASSSGAMAADDKAVATAVAAFNDQWSKWTYVLPPHRSAAVTPTRAALLKEPDDR